MATAGTDLDVGSEFAGCRIDSVAGVGGMGVVYRATHLRLERAVALKVIAPKFARDPAFRNRFERESRLAASIDHPGVIPVYEAGEYAGRLYIAMRYVEGTDLRARIEEHGRLSPSAASHVIAQVAEALDAAHARGLVHRDVKPANILLAPQRFRFHAYLTDFGLSKRVGSETGLTKAGEWLGTVDYVAPEQVMGRGVDARADVYALGCVMYHALTGRVPFERESDVAKVWAQVNDSPPRLYELVQDVPAEYQAVIDRATAKDPSDRYQSAGDLGRAAAAAAEGRSPEAPERSVAAGSAAPLRALDQAATTLPPAPPPAPPTEPAGGFAHPRPPSLPTQPLPAGPGPSRGSGRAWIFAAAVVLAVGAIAATLIAVTMNSDDGGSEPAANVSDGDSPDDGASGDENETPSPSVSERRVRALLTDYELAWSAHSVSQLDALLSSSFTRTNDDGTLSRDAALQEYECQFAKFPGASYDLESIRVTATTASTAEATAHYTISSGAEGPISFSLVKENGDLLISHVTVPGRNC